MATIVRYRVKAECAEENIAFIQAVFAELERTKPDGLRYASFRLADGVSFVHVAEVETPDGANPLLALEAFQRFTKDIKDRCEEPPITSKAERVGAYRAFGG